MPDIKVLTLDQGVVKEATVNNDPVVQTVLKVDGGNASTSFPEYLLRMDFGANGASINPTGNTT